MQNTAPAKNVPGIIMSGLAVPNAFLVRNGTAIPTNEIGPANAVTHADRILDNKINATRKSLMFTPMLCAYPSPNWYAPIGFDRKNVKITVIPTITAAT